MTPVPRAPPSKSSSETFVLLKQIPHVGLLRSSDHMSTSLVFVHGFNGHPIDTWTDSQTQVFWPRDLLPSVLPEITVLSFGYGGEVHSNSGIRDCARNFLNCLNIRRRSVP